MSSIKDNCDDLQCYTWPKTNKYLENVISCTCEKNSYSKIWKILEWN